jgi:hypothetical protein
MPLCPCALTRVYAYTMIRISACKGIGWYAGTLVRWYAGTAVRWYAGTLVRWYAGTAVRWFGGCGCWACRDGSGGQAARRIGEAAKRGSGEAGRAF